MQIEIGAPACLPLALVGLEDGSIGRLGVTLRHPAINLAARAGHWLDVTGARADLVSFAVQGYLQAAGLPEKAVVEVELATPSLMGLGSDALMALAGIQATAWVHGQPFTNVLALAETSLGPDFALEAHSYAQGGVLIVDFPTQARAHDGGLSVDFPRQGGPVAPIRRRHTLSHPDDHAWAFVLFLPRVPDSILPNHEHACLGAWVDAAPHLDAAAAQPLTDQLWAALESDDINGFGRALLALQDVNTAALDRSGHPLPISDAERVILDICRDHGAVAWGRSPTGLALYALIRGASPSVALRKKIQQHVGFGGGTVMASVVDNEGARHVIHQGKAPIYTGASPLVSGG